MFRYQTKGKGCSRWLLQAGAVLMLGFGIWGRCAEAFFVHPVESGIDTQGNGGFSSRRISAHDKFMAELGAVPFCAAKNVVVFGPTPTSNHEHDR